MPLTMLLTMSLTMRSLRNQFLRQTPTRSTQRDAALQTVGSFMKIVQLAASKRRKSYQQSHVVTRSRNPKNQRRKRRTQQDRMEHPLRPTQSPKELQLFLVKCPSSDTSREPRATSLLTLRMSRTLTDRCQANAMDFMVILNALPHAATCHMNLLNTVGILF